mgnify:FL=1|tara:strand:- start:550 stop:825 length:276 start_codon:yes stop_codon:yes gene_type:complete
MKEDLLKVIEQDLYDVEGRKDRNEEYLYNRVSKFRSPTQTINYPDAKKHQIVSFIKSGIRILGYIFIPFNLVVSAILLILSEIVGIIEELV